MHLIMNILVNWYIGVHQKEHMDLFKQKITLMIYCIETQWGLPIQQYLDVVYLLFQTENSAMLFVTKEEPI